MKVWITKYALTKGISEMQGSVSVVNPKTFNGPGWWDSFYKDDWHKTKAEAVEKAEAMRVARIASLKKSIARLEKLKFTA